jgi:deazaflavin-dependent oxidoreductase (nitroreductase family)
MNHETISGNRVESFFTNRLPYPNHPLVKKLARSPLLLWRIGFGPVIGRVFLVLTHLGRKSGKVRRTALEYRIHDGRIYVFSAWPRSDWFQNILAQPRVTVQTSRGAFGALARPLQSSADYIGLYQMLEHAPVMRPLLEELGMANNLNDFLRQKEQLTVVTFDPTDLPTPPALETDLKWVAPLTAGAFALGYLLGKRKN